MRTDCKEVKAKIREHILDYCTVEELVEQVKAIKCYAYPTDYHAVKHMAEGGCFLIYHYQVRDFLNGLGINPTNKKYSIAKSWKLYCHLIARDAQLIIKHANK